MIARAESALALGTVIIGPLQMQRAQYAFKRLLVAAVILSRSAAGAWYLWPRMIGGIGVQPLFQRSGCQAQSLPSRRHLHGFEIQVLDGLRP